MAWAAFSLFAAALQSQLELRDWMSPMMMEATNIYLAAGILIAAGVSLETMKQIDSQLTMRNYEGFLK